MKSTRAEKKEKKKKNVKILFMVAKRTGGKAEKWTLA